MSAHDDDYDQFDLDEAMMRSIASVAAHGGVAGSLSAETLKQNLQDNDFYNQFSNILDLSDVAPSAKNASKKA